MALLVGLCAACGGDGGIGNAGDDPADGRAPDAAGAPETDGGNDDTDPGGDAAGATAPDDPADPAGGNAPDPLAPALPDGLWSDPDAPGRTLTVTEGGTTVTYSAGDPPTSCWGRPRPAEGEAGEAVAVDFACLAGDAGGEGSPVPEDRTALLRPSGDGWVVEWEDGAAETLLPDLS
ncbi:hypothetical protein [Streptomyces calidiresistens]|uniref:Uncharacterized protein n=1 Tax=Streptomyces calidiresistens TaxID=1485586 RepID=A0A7W3SZC3_9ACTN|nr:hypothetical protein [Streptomyces calidiresistens]MBB0228104.1 hypothetical protein [Streptomyces calidiresistens]